MRTSHCYMFVVASMIAGMTLIKPTTAFAQHHPKMSEKATAKGEMASGNMMADCMKMMEKHKQMQTMMAGMDKKLADMNATVKARTGSEKMDAMAALVSEMVMQRKQMNEKMATMQSEMMQHMMKHMSMGSNSMMTCPMMKGMDMKAMKGMKGM
ncbi:MAG: hypothetical protein ABJA67_00615 [Chthonomonadales bacterium]